jgi:ferritin-like metal-binding protein YciE
MLIAQKQQLITWLNNAHAMELSLEKNLEDHVKDAATMGELRDALEAHLLATRRHAIRLSEAIHKLGGTVSQVRSVLASTMGRLEGISTALFKDEIVKDFLADYAAEQFEVACYTSLIAAAEEFSETEVAELCRKNLHEDRAMADWLLTQIPVVTRRYLTGEAPVSFA